MIGVRMFLPPSCMLGNHAAALSATPVELMVLGIGVGVGVRVGVGVSLRVGGRVSLRTG